MLSVTRTMKTKKLETNSLLMAKLDVEMAKYNKLLTVYPHMVPRTDWEVAPVSLP